jgi:hypothetical protein
MGDTFYLIPLVIAAIMSSSVFLYAGFLFLTPPRGDTLVTKMRTHEAAHTAPAPATSSLAVAPPLPNSPPHEATHTAPAPTTPPLIVAPPLPTSAPREATQTVLTSAAPSPAAGPPLPNSARREATQTVLTSAAPSPGAGPPLPNSAPHEATQTALTSATTPNYLATVSRFLDIYSQRAQEKAMSNVQYRARWQYLHQQQVGIEQRLTDPNLSAVERSQLERQYAYWGRAIREMLVLP